MRIVICEDSALLRDGLVRVLEYAQRQVVAALPDTSRLFSVVDSEDPDLVILDVRLPPTWTDEGIHAARQLREQHPGLPILVLSQYVEERYAADLIRTDSRALGYLLKDRVTHTQDFLDAATQVAQGGTVLDPEVVTQLLTRQSSREALSALTEREHSVLSLIAEGKSNQAIAERLFLSPGSIEKHITAIFQKLGLPQDGSGNRRVLAVLAHLEAQSHQASVPAHPTPSNVNSPRSTS